MGSNVYNESGATDVHITAINQTAANLASNLDQCQVGFETDAYYLHVRGTSTTHYKYPWCSAALTANDVARWDSSTGLTQGLLRDTGTKVGVGTGATTPDSLFQVYGGSAGTVTAPSGTLVTYEDDASFAVSHLAPDGTNMYSYWGGPGDNDAILMKFLYQKPGGSKWDVSLDGNTMLTLYNYWTPRFAINNARLGVGTGNDTPDSLAHFYGGSAGTVTAQTSTVVTIENSDSAYLSILTPSNKIGGVLFGDADLNIVGWMKYFHSGLDAGSDLGLDFGVEGQRFLTLKKNNVGETLHTIHNPLLADIDFSFYGDTYPIAVFDAGLHLLRMIDQKKTTWGGDDDGYIYYDETTTDTHVVVLKLPTTDPLVANQLWNYNGDVMISAGPP